MVYTIINFGISIIIMVLAVFLTYDPLGAPQYKLNTTVHTIIKYGI